MKNTLSIGKNGFLILLLIALLPSKVPAQVLNDQVTSLLVNNCARLDLPGEPGLPDTTGLGLNLRAICSFSQVNDVANSTGGGAASVQGSAASIQNRVLLRLLEQIYEEEDPKHAGSSSMRLNPFSSLLS